MVRLTILAIALGMACSSKTEGERPLVAEAKRCADSELGCPRPIVRVENLRASEAYYRDALGFKVDWEDGDPPDFAGVSRSDVQIFLCEQCQGRGGSWTWVFAKNVNKLHEEFVKRKAFIKEPPADKPWGMREMQVTDLDGNVIRFGSAIDD